MANTSAVDRRVEQLRQHLLPLNQAQQSAQIQSVPCAVHHRSLPRFDVTFMEHYLETDRGLKHEVYDLFKQQPELLYPVEEGMTKGKQALCQTSKCTLNATTCLQTIVFAEQHREFVRRQLKLILSSGYSPMSFFMKDYRKYFYMAELLALVDLSLVSS